MNKVIRAGNPLKRVFFLPACIGMLATTAHAANITFVGENGSGDLSGDANWNGNTKPGTSDTAVFDTSGTLTSSTLFSPYGYTFKGTGLVGRSSPRTWELREQA